MSDNDENNSVILKNGVVIQLHSEPQSLASTTGWVTWNASIAVIRYLERHSMDNKNNHSDMVKGCHVADLSTGNGLVALAMAYLGASSVMATEVPACSTLTRVNIATNPMVEHVLNVVDYTWGDKFCPIQACDLVIGSDLLFIAIRDSIYDQLRKTILDICAANNKLLFCYEERILDKEQAFMKSLEEDLQVCSIPEDQIDVGSDSTDIFYEPPSIRMYILTSKA
jgi:predicted nicotinamide N-methyase